MPQLELSSFDVQFIIACILGMVRRAQERMPEREAIRFTAAMAETISRLNHGSISDQDVDVICLSIKKTLGYLDTDFKLSHTQKQMTRKAGVEIQTKFERAQHGTLPHIWNDGERQNDAGETPSITVQVQ